jgi:hypothetical protein
MRCVGLAFLDQFVVAPLLALAFSAQLFCYVFNLQVVLDFCTFGFRAVLHVAQSETFLD